MSYYAWRTDAASGVIEAANVDEVVATLVAIGEWSPIDSAEERRYMADGAWLRITTAGDPSEVLYKRGTP